jgi:phenylpropionate dioxygenase-like ring-hydroxylating dioxygenase large terminal subunit
MNDQLVEQGMSAGRQANLSRALHLLTETVARPFTDARALPPEIYTSTDVLALEHEQLFRKEWICVGRASAIAEPGAYLTYEIAGQPIIVLRDQAGSVRAFSNICLHRMSGLLEGCGRISAIVCPYHAWTYGLDGRLRAAPHMERTAGFCKNDYRLPELRTETWLGWIYVTLNPNIAAIAERLSQLTDLIGRYHMEAYVETFRDELVWNTNWKILAENFMESYHLPTLHRATIGPASKIDEMDCPPGSETFNYHWITKDSSLAIGNAHPDNTSLEGDWRKTVALMTIFPTQLVSLTPGYFWYLLLAPRGVGQVHIVFAGGLAPDFFRDPQGPKHMDTLKTLLDRVNAEDRQGVESVFRNAHAPLARPGHLSYLERPNYDFARYLARQLTDGIAR